MGTIVSAARAAFRASLATFKLTPNRAQLRRFVASTVDAGNEWLAAFDGQEAKAHADFAETKQAQFNAFTASLPEPVLSPDPPADPAP